VSRGEEVGAGGDEGRGDGVDFGVGVPVDGVPGGGGVVVVSYDHRYGCC